MDTYLSPHDWFREANELFLAAHNDIAHAEDITQARGLRDQASLQIDKSNT
jgi:hypothetical protein